MAHGERTRQDLSQKLPGASASPSPAGNAMAAITSLINPINEENYLVFYNDPNNQLAAVQAAISNLGPPLYDPGATANADVHTGYVANPSTLTSVLYQNQVPLVISLPIRVS